MQTYSRYDFMKEGKVKDEVSGNYYPDPLSLNYLNYFLKAQYTNDLPVEVKLTENNIRFFLNTVDGVYFAPIYDDIILTLNKYSHKNFLKVGDIIKFPNVSLIESSFDQGRI